MSTRPVWNLPVEQPSFPQLSGNISVDVAIIGGGITGITAAYLLSKAGKRVAVLEAHRIAGSTTGSSTGNLYAPVGGDGLQTISQKWDDDRLRGVVQSRSAAVDFIERTVQELSIECDFRRVPWCLFAEQGSNSTFVNNERAAAAKAGLTVVDGIPLSIPIDTGFTVPNQAQFNPLQYTVGLAGKIQSENCPIFENTKVTDVREGTFCTVETTGGAITAGQVIMATHTPKGRYLVHTLMEPYREHAMAVMLNGDYPEPGIFWNMREQEHYSLRTCDTPHGKVLMVLGESHKVGMKEWNYECFQRLEDFLRMRFDVASLAYRWSAQQYRPADSLPYIGISPGNQKTYIATGFAADGLTYGTLAAMIITDQILGVGNRWSDTYRATRLTPVASFGKAVKENVSVAFELIKDRLTKSDVESLSEVRPREGKVMEVDGKRCAVHRDEGGELHIVSAVCPHLGCIVHWNWNEQSWDCPCHGSRFTPDGEVIEGPAIEGLKQSGLQQ